MINWLAAVVDDLRNAAAELLRPGLSPAMSIQGGASWASDPVWLAQTLSDLVPTLLADLNDVESSELQEDVATTSMRRPRQSRRPTDYVSVLGMLVPQRWLEVRPVAVADSTSLNWLLFVLARVQQDVSAVITRMERQIAGALEARQGTSDYARQDVDGLINYADQHHEAATKLIRAIRSVHQASPTPLRPTDRLPRLIPRAQAWTLFRRLADVALRPQAYLQNRVRHLLHSDTSATLPFLYQRWVGLKVVEAMASLGFTSTEDPIGSIFLGGPIRLIRGDLAITLWCEARLQRSVHPSGLQTSSSEAQPDFVLVFPGDGGNEAFVLDATLAGGDDQLARKARYRELLEFQNLRMVAGIPVRRRPMRAWAASPLATNHCRLSAPDGSIGAVPMLPGRYTATPIAAWLGDAVAHAEAWHSHGLGKAVIRGIGGYDAR